MTRVAVLLAIGLCLIGSVGAAQNALLLLVAAGIMRAVSTTRED